MFIPNTNGIMPFKEALPISKSEVRFFFHSLKHLHGELTSSASSETATATKRDTEKMMLMSFILICHKTFKSFYVLKKMLRYLENSVAGAGRGGG